MLSRKGNLKHSWASAVSHPSRKNPREGGGRDRCEVDRIKEDGASRWVNLDFFGPEYQLLPDDAS